MWAGRSGGSRELDMLDCKIDPQHIKLGTNSANPMTVSSKTAKTYNTTDSLVVTDPTTSAAVRGLSKGERTGSRAFLCIWSYVIAGRVNSIYVRELGVVGGFWLTGVCTKHGKRYGVRIGGSTSMLTSVQQPTNYPMGNSYSCR